LRTFYEYSCQQIADKLDISLRTVHRDLAGALEAVHAARASIEGDRGSLFARMIRRRNGRRER
jgi:DNA-directed RNA polymerase specialized sigma24 family protein